MNRNFYSFFFYFFFCTEFSIIKNSKRTECMANNAINNLTDTARELKDAGKLNRCIFTFGHTTFNVKDISLIHHSHRILNLFFKNGLVLELWFEDPQHACNAYRDIIRVMGDDDLHDLVHYRMERGKESLLQLLKLNIPL